MKVFFLYLLIVVNDGNYYWEKIPFGLTLNVKKYNLLNTKVFNN